MSVRRGVPSLFAAAFVAVSLSAGAGQVCAAIPEAVYRDIWTEVKTAHFTVLTNASEGVGAGVGKKLEQLCAVLGIANPTLRAVPSLPTDVYVFRDTTTFNAYQPPAVENVAGYSNTYVDRGVVVIQVQLQGENKDHVLCHEFTHVYVANNFASMPVWLNEGLAEYYGTFRPRGRVAEVGHRIDWRLEWMRTHPPAAIDLLFAANTGARAYQKDNDLRRTIYAQGWLMVHYLQSDPRYAAGFQQFLDGVHHGATPRTAFQALLPPSGWPAFLEGLKTYAKEGTLEPRTIQLDAKIEAAETKSREVGVSETLTRLGELLMELGEDTRPAAEEHFMAALARDSLNALAAAGLGLAVDAHGDSAGAEALYRRAAAAAPNDARIFAMAGRGTTGRLYLGRGDRPLSEDAIAPLVRLARSRYARSLELDPENLEAAGEYGKSFMNDREIPPDGMQALEKAADAMPARADLAATLAEFRARIGQKSGEAMATEPVSPMVTSGETKHPQHKRVIDSQEVEDAFTRADQAIGRGDYDDAIMDLERARDRTTEVETKLAAEWQLKIVRMTKAMNEGVAYWKAGNLERAKNVFETVLSWSPEGERRAAVEELLRKVDSRIAVNRGLALVKSNHLAEAKKTFEDLLKTPLDDDTRKYVLGVIKQIDASLPRAKR